MTWADLPPQGDIFFYLVTGIGCADGTTEQVFSPFTHGCAGLVSFISRSSLCAAGWHVCSAVEWMTTWGGQLPTYDYWTDDNLLYTGTGPMNCSVSVILQPGYLSCPASLGPMLVCTPMGLDSLGNRCNWYECGYQSIYPNQQYFGGCSNGTAGVLCCDP